MKQQEELYLVFVKLKKIIGLTHFYKSLAMFQQTRSAKIIQRWWRKIFWNRKEKEVEKEKKVTRMYFTLRQSLYCA